MSELTTAQIESIITTSRDNAAALAESFNQCFDLKLSLIPGVPEEWSADRDASLYTVPGVVVALSLGGQGIVLGLPVTLPLPDWISAPDKSQNARLQTLAMEWGLNLLPEDLLVETSSTRYCENLWDELVRTVPAEGARSVAWSLGSTTASVASPDGETEASLAETAQILMVLPVAVPAPVEAAAPAAPAASPAAGSAPTLGSLGGRPVSPIDDFRQRARRLFHLPVSVSVRLAEKKIPMGQLLSITPGALITFSKPCEDLLDLYINNSRYCRGEAVKIGEKFGLKVHEVGVVDVRKEKII